MRRFADFMAAGLGLTAPPAERHVVLFSRTRNRKILNEAELVRTLAARTGRTVRILRLETNSTHDIIRALRGAQLAVGLHGSALVLSMFMQPGAGLLELYP